MTNEELKALAEKIVVIAKQAGVLIVNSKINQVKEKGAVSNVVTDVDSKCQKFIIAECSKCLVQSYFLAEEDDQQMIGDEYTWVIDPIDGTSNYMYDYHHSCISIALYYQKKGLIGVVYNPYLDECFVGIEGIGSTCNQKPIHVSDNELNKALVMFGTAPYDKQLAEQTFKVMHKVFLKTRDIRRSGSAALDLCYLAAGRVDAFYEQMLQPWDYGAGNIILKNAQGVIEAITIGAIEDLKPTGLICSNGKCHEAFKALISEC